MTLMRYISLSWHKCRTYAVSMPLRDLALIYKFL